MIQNDSIAKLATGSIGIATSELAPIIVEDTSNIVQIVVQVIIGIATLIGLFKKKKVIN